LRGNPWPLLTFRGKAFVVVGGLSSVLSILLGQRDALWFGLLLLMVPIVALVVVARARLRLSCERRVSPAQVVVGDPLVGELVVSKAGTLPTGLLHFEDEVPPGLGRTPRFTAQHFTGEWRRDITYPLAGTQRGRYTTGPLTVRASDPFGMVNLDRRFTATSDVMVTPRIVPLPGMRNASGAGMSGDASPQKIGVVGQDDVLVREYRAGDDVRRVHWRSTARRNEIMVRREEQAWDPAAAVLLDSRFVAHEGEGRDGSFEWAVSAAASVAVHFVETGFRVDLFDADGTMVTHQRAVHASATRQQVVEKMTEVGLSSRPTFDRAVEAMSAAQGGQLVVAVTGRLSAGDADLLLGTQRNRAKCIALVIDVDSYASSAERSSDAERAEHADAVRLLRDHRWRVLEVERGVDLLDAWSQLDRMGDFV
jgi:uncharacterized protein (DUF58 family)